HLEHLPGGIVDDTFDALPHGVHVPAMLDHIIVKPEPPVPTARIERRADLVPTANADPVPRQHALGDASASSEEPAPGSRLARAPARLLYFIEETGEEDRKSTRLNSSHGSISYAVFCLKKKRKSNQKSNHAQTIHI